MRNRIIPYNPKLKQIARRLRKNSTLSEILLWKVIKGREIKGYEFHRQVPIDKYIVDFYCHELMLAIEVDGISHIDRYKADFKREKRLEGLGVSFLRFSDVDIKKNLEGVVQAIEIWIEKYENERDK